MYTLLYSSHASYTLNPTCCPWKMHTNKRQIHLTAFLCCLFGYAIFGLHFRFFARAISHKYSHFPVLIISCLKILTRPFHRALARFEYAKCYLQCFKFGIQRNARLSFSIRIGCVFVLPFKFTYTHTHTRTYHAYNVCSCLNSVAYFPMRK